MCIVNAGMHFEDGRFQLQTFSHSGMIRSGYPEDSKPGSVAKLIEDNGNFVD